MAALLIDEDAASPCVIVIMAADGLRALIMFLCSCGGKMTEVMILL
jgi:hypothetical protein